MRRIFFVSLFTAVLIAVVYLGFERLVSDIATRVRYALRDAAIQMETSHQETYELVLKPNVWPDGCGDRRYRLTLSPYAGNKAVYAPDIHVFCEGSTHYWTGTNLQVHKEMSVEKNAHDEITIVLKKTLAHPDGASDIEITELR